MATVNKSELAKLLKITAPTLDRLIDRYADFPVQERGSNGRNYAFDADQVLAFLAQKRREETEAHELRMAELNSVEIPLLAKAVSAEASGMTPGQKLQTIKAASELDKLALSRASLVEAAAMREALKDLFRGLGQYLEGLPATLVRKHNLPPTMLDALRQSLRAERRRLHEQLLYQLGQGAGQLELTSVAAE